MGKLKSGSKRTKDNKRLAIILLTEFILLIGLIVGYTWYSFNQKIDKIAAEIPPEEIEVAETVTDTMKQYKNIAIFGLDAREKNTDLTKPGIGRSDSIMIASINNETKEVKVVSIYRDTMMEVAKEYPTMDKITHAYFLGGPKMAIETLNRNLDLDITEYVTVDFMAVTNAVDALGGVTIDVKANELNNLNHNMQEQMRISGTYVDGIWSEGKQTLNGTQALAYARIRKVGNGDFERASRQRIVIGAMVDKAKESDLSTLNKVIDQVFPQVATSLTSKEILDLAKDVFSYELGENAGFPYTHEEPTLSVLGSVVVAEDLLNNVEALHKFLFPDDVDYTPSETVRQISDRITSESGVYNKLENGVIPKEETTGQ